MIFELGFNEKEFSTLIFLWNLLKLNPKEILFKNFQIFCYLKIV